MTPADETELVRLRAEVQHLRLAEANLRAEVLRIGHELSMLRGRCRDGEYQPSVLTPSRSHG